MPETLSPQKVVPASAALNNTPKSRSFMQQTLHDTFVRPGARFGALWITVIAFLGIFAPLLASSHPILLKTGGEWSSPMWRYLTPVDLVLLALFVAATCSMRLLVKHFVRGLLTILVVLVVVAVLAFSFKSVPSSVNFQQYRELERQGKADFILRTLIPYSATDRLRDRPGHRLTMPLASLGVVTLTNGSTIEGVISESPDKVEVLENGLNREVPRAAVKSIEIEPLRTRHLLGTEIDGADLLSRMIHATRIALSVGLISTSIALLIGCIIGGLMGFFVGRVDLIGMRLIEVFEAIPTLLVLITIMASWGRSLYLMMAVIGLLSWTGTARFVRAEFLRLRNQDFVQAAVASGLNTVAIIYRHILPNGLTPVLVTATFGVAGAILTEATLSFLGLGLIDEPSWGQMLNQARSGGQGFVWWMAVFPGLAIFLTVYAYALIGDSMRDALDPKLKKRD